MGLPGSQLIRPHAPSSITPESLTTASTRCFAVSSRLRLNLQIGHFQNFNDAESGSLSLGSRVRLAGLRRSRLLAPAPARLRVERAIYTTTSLQIARSARLSWRTNTKPILASHRGMQIYETKFS